MSIQASTPGVHIVELTRPGVIQGVGTSTAAFVGPTPAGPPGPRRVTTYDDFVALYGGRGPFAPHLVSNGRLFHLGIAVRGFFENGGTAAFVVRVDNSVLGSLDLANGDGATVASVQARTPEATPSVAVVTDPGADVVFASATVTDPGGAASPIPGDATNDLFLDDASGFAVGDRVTTDGTVSAQLTAVDGDWVRLSSALPAGATLETAPLDPGWSDGSFRVEGAADAFRIGSLARLTNSATTEDVVVLSAAGDRMTTTSVSAAFVLDGTTPRVTPAPYVLASATSAISSVADRVVTVADGSGFGAGDVVSAGGPVATVVGVDGNEVTVDSPLAGADLTIADLTPDRRRFRVLDSRGLRGGTVLRLFDGANEAVGIVSSVSTSNLVTLTDTVARTVPIAAGAEATPVEVALVVTDGASRETFPGLSMNPTSSGYLFTAAAASTLVTVAAPDPPVVASVERLTPVALAETPLSPGTAGDPANLGLGDYQAALGALARVDDVNIVCAPDVASMGNADQRRAVQQAMLTHCLEQADRITVLDPPVGLPPSGPGSIEEFRLDVQSERGFAALYWPWLVVLDPTQVSPAAPRRILVPPSGHVAGVMARVDAERGVFKAPANVPVRNVLGIERQVTDREQAPLNRGGTNVLRILPGSNEVMVWGARTTVDPTVTDWVYVNVRRLVLFLEESIAESIRGSVFEPNDTGLWKRLERLIRAFLREQWRAGALFGRTEEEAFLVRIDEGLNPPEVRAVGRLNIEIRVAPVRPAEFIVVTFGLFDGAADVDEP